MALNVEAITSGRTSTVTTHKVSTTVAGGLTNSYLVVLTSVQDSNHANTPLISVVWGDLNIVPENLTKIRSDEGTGNNRTEIWVRVNPTASTDNVVLSVTGSVGEVAAFCYVISGATQSTTPDAQAGTTGNAQNPSLNITTVANNALILSILSTEATISAAGSGQTISGPLIDQSFENAAASWELLTTAGTDAQAFTTGSGQSYAFSIISLSPFVPPIVFSQNMKKAFQSSGRPRPFAPGIAR